MERPSFKRKGDFGGQDSSRKSTKMSFAEKMMAKMGHKEGHGLGKDGTGRLEPIDVKMRPQGAGVGAVKEKTKQAKEEEKRQAKLRGEDYVDESEEEREANKRRKRILKESGGLSSGASTPRARTAISQKTKYRTAEQITADAEGLVVPVSLKSVIDLTGKQQKLLTSTSGLMVSGGTTPAQTDAEKIANRARRDLEAYAESWNNLKDRYKDVEFEQDQLQAQLDKADVQIKKAQDLHSTVEELGRLQSLEDVTGYLKTMQKQYRDDIKSLDLAAVAVAALLPWFTQAMRDWDPLKNPHTIVHEIEDLRKILGIDQNERSVEQDRKDALDRMLVSLDRTRRQKHMTPYETMIYTIWLPTVRTAVINNWNPHKPSALVKLIDVWKNVLPRFVYNSLVNQVIEQKLSAAVAKWNPRLALRKDDPKLLPHVWLFPWLPHLAKHHVDPYSSSGLVTDVRRKYARALDSWNLSDGVIPGFKSWSEVFAGKLDDMLVRHLLPNMSNMLERELEIDPAQQNMKPIEDVLQWASLLKPKYVGELLVIRFFPKWLSILHTWLTNSPNYEEIGQWFAWWKQQFPKDVVEWPSVAEQFEKGLAMINHALDLGDRVATDLPAPVTAEAKPAKTTEPSKPPVKEAPPRKKEEEEVTFKDAVEEWCASENLLLIPLREADSRTGLPVFKITASATGKGGVRVYMRGDVLYVQDKKDRTTWEPMGLDDSLIARAEGG